jgi:hypothetical protein
VPEEFAVRDFPIDADRVEDEITFFVGALDASRATWPRSGTASRPSSASRKPASTTLRC